jgi:hypothetical protein
VTAVVAWIALLVSISSLGWQIASWHRSGSRLRVDLVEARPSEPGTADNGLAVVVTNVGRQTATLHGIRLALTHETAVTMRNGEGGSHTLVLNSEGVTLPVKLDHGEELVVVWSSDDVATLLDFAHRGRRDLVGTVRSGRRQLKTQSVQGVRYVDTLPPRRDKS